MAPFGLKLWENAFRSITDISSFDLENQKYFGFLDILTEMMGEYPKISIFPSSRDVYETNVNA